MKALSLHQPWASLMAIGAKVNETRPRPLDYQGDIAICATRLRWFRNFPEYAIDALRWLWFHKDSFPGYHANIRDLYLSLPFGKVVAIVTKTGCIQVTDEWKPKLSLQEEQLGDYRPGRFYYPTTNLRPLKNPVSVLGRQSLFELPPIVLAEVLKEL